MRGLHTLSEGETAAMNTQNRKNILLTVAAATAIICMVVLLFFRTSVYTGILGRIVGIFQPFIYGAVIAYLLRPVCEKLEQKLHMKRGLSILLSVVGMFVLITLLLVAVIPELIASITELISGLPAAAAQMESWLSALLEEQSELLEMAESTLNVTTQSLGEFLQTHVLPQLRNIMNNMSTGFSGVLNVVKNFVLGTIIAIYLLGSWEKFGLQLKMLVYAVFPHKVADWIGKEARFTDEKFSGFIFGKLVDSLIIGILCFIFMLIARMPYAMLISIIVGVTNIIPFFGPYLGAIPSAILILTVSPVRCVVFVVFIIILQQLDGNVIGPKILGDKLGLSAFWILFSILVFGSLWGVLGMLIGAPVFAVLYDIVRSFVLDSLAQKKELKILQEYEADHAEVGSPSESKGK